ncbi:AAA-domain-containing protein [Xylariaceae sp. AK1471]|nr:AAA-domain-containing protein [Xylariaceae sp. AK1471]
MSSQWLRAFRSAAQNPRRTRLLSPPTRSFSSTAPSQAPDDSSNTPRDDGRKPENETSSGEAEGTEENILGESTTVTNGEGQGRKRPANGLRSRALRNRKSDLPPVQIPKSFLGLAIDRHGEKKTWLHAKSAIQSQDGTSKEDRARAVADLVDLGFLEVPIKLVFKKSAWSTSAVGEVCETLVSKGNIGPFLKRMNIFSVAAYLAVLHQVKSTFGDDAYREILETDLTPKSLDWVTPLLEWYRNGSVIFRPQFIQLLLDYVVDGGKVPLTKVALYEPCIIDEIITAVRAELLIRAPENTRLAGVRRPTTIINVQDCSAFSVVQDTLQHVADDLGADVLHLRAVDIAHIVGRYVGQDVTRTPGDISLLGYTAAENSGRLKPRPSVEEENEDDDASETTFAFMLPHGKLRKDAKRQTMSMEEFLLSSGTRGKSDELWEDMKVNAALDELVHSADVDVAEQKPLIVHIHDFNALNMDETGAIIMGKIQKVVDELWISGRKVALVGSCSTNDAPKLYQTALKGLETTERVIHLSQRSFHNTEAHVHCRAALARWEKQDNLRENDENIVRMLWSMTESSDFMSTHSERTLGLAQYADNDLAMAPRPQFAKYWSSVLPMSEIYRIATTMIGSTSTSTTELFSLDCFEKADAKMAAVDIAKEKAARSQKSPEPFKKGSKGDTPTETRKNDPFAEKHEEKLMSSLVNARDLRTTFKDIHAPQETIDSVKMLTTLSLVRPEAFSYGVLANDRIPGCLLYGPPGTGKTLLAKAVAKESGANMIEVDGASISNMYVGESAKNVRALFKIAKKKEPMVIFIDEADALLGARSNHPGAGRRETINQFLQEWDGMNKTKAFIMVATNRPFDLDDAVLRRLPRKLLIDLPLETDRAAILRIHLKDEAVDETVSLEDIAKRTPLYSGSDLKNVCVAAAMAAVKEELEASERHTGPEPYKWAEKRILSRRHFDKALKEIGASSSEDMSTLTAIRKFDERYGDGKERKKRKGMGFEVVPEAPDSEQARIRSGR